MKAFLILMILSHSSAVFAKMDLTKEIKRGPIVKDSCGSFDDGVSALQRLQDTSSFDNDGQIAFYNFSARAMAALYKQKMINEKNKAKRAQYRQQYLLACRQVG